LGGTFFESCRRCEGVATSDCSQCGRTSDNYLFVRAGDGDGTYPIFGLEIEGCSPMTVTFFDEDEVFVGQLIEAVHRGLSEKNLPLAAESLFWTHLQSLEPSLAANYVGRIEASRDHEREGVWGDSFGPLFSLVFADANHGLNSESSIVAETFTGCSTHDVVLFSARDDANNSALIPRVMVTISETDIEEVDRLEGLDLSRETGLWMISVARNRVGSGSSLAMETNQFNEMAMVLADPDFWTEPQWLAHLAEAKSWQLVLGLNDEVTRPSRLQLFAEDTPEDISMLCRIRGADLLAESYFDKRTNSVGPSFLFLKQKLDEFDPSE
jgi:hypothetical protein